MHLKDGTMIEIGEETDCFKEGQWWEFLCEIYFPNGTNLEGAIQGDGHNYAIETLVDENGDELTWDKDFKILPPSKAVPVPFDNYNEANQDDGPTDAQIERNSDPRLKPLTALESWNTQDEHNCG